MKNNLQPSPAFVRPNISGNVNSHNLDIIQVTTTTPITPGDTQGDVVLSAREGGSASGYLLWGLFVVLVLLILSLYLSVYRRSRSLK